VNDVFVGFTIMKLKYILVEYSTFWIYIYIYIFIDKTHYCSQNIELCDAVDFHVKAHGMQYSIITTSDDCSTGMINPNIILMIKNAMCCL